MVRVGGGWVALDEFLVKNDPCRGKIHLNSKSIENDFELVLIERCHVLNGRWVKIYSSTFFFFHVPHLLLYFSYVHLQIELMT